MKRLTKSQYEEVAYAIGKGLKKANADHDTLLEVEKQLVKLFLATDDQFKPQNLFTDMMNARYEDNWPSVA